MRGWTRCAGVFLMAVMVLAARPAREQPEPAPEREKPLFRDFMGLNVHTVLFKPDLYKPVCRLVRDYHPFDWDTGPNPGTPTTFPLARNRVDWQQVYGSWRKDGYGIDACIQFDNVPPSAWKDPAHDAFAYGQAFARYFGPSGPNRLADSIEIGNEPGLYDDATYRAIFENMARGVRQADPKLKVVTCAVTPGKSHRYAKSLSCFKGLEGLYDVISLHDYAEVEGYPTWRRSYPEDPSIAYLKDAQAVIAWRDANAPGKPVWITEFGYDASTKPAPPTGDFSKWVGSTETQQAQWLVRSFLVFSAMPIDRAYIFFFDDKDEPHVHGSSGLTRNYVPKPAFHAVAHLYRTLGDYRFARVVAQRPGDLYCYEYRRGADPRDRVWAVWSPTGSGRQSEQTLPAPPGPIARAERMPLKPGPAVPVPVHADGASLRLSVTESPVYLSFSAP